MARITFEDKLVEVCDECLQASCWHGKFMCQESQGAGTVLKTVRELRALGYESPDYWSDEALEDLTGEAAPHGYRIGGAVLTKGKTDEE